MTFRIHLRSPLIPKNLPKMTFRRHFRSILIPKNLPKTTDFRICTTILSVIIFMVQQIWSPNLPIMTFSLCTVIWNSWIPQMTLFDFNVKKEFWSFLLPENLSKMTFFELNFENLPKTTYFLIRSKSPQNDNYFFGRFFQKKKTIPDTCFFVFWKNQPKK